MMYLPVEQISKKLKTEKYLGYEEKICFAETPIWKTNYVIWFYVTLIGLFFLHMFLHLESYEKTFAYLTYQTWWMFNLYGAGNIFLYVTKSCRITSEKFEDTMLLVLLNLRTIAFTLEVGVFIGFWTCLFDANSYTNAKTVFLCLTVHLFTIPLICLDIYFSQNPFSFKHVWMPMFYLLAYQIFHYVYVRYSGKKIYPIFDWKNELGMCIFLACLSIIVLPIFHFFVCYMTSLSKKEDNNPLEKIEDPVNSV